MFADIPLPTAEVHAYHPFKNERSHEVLLQYLRERLLIGKESRDANLDRLVRIDKHVAGWMRLSEEDQKRDYKEQRDGTPQAVKVNLPITFVHLDDMMTYYLETFAPNRGMFYTTGKPNELEAGSQIITVFNNNAIYTGYYTQCARAIYNTLKYNEGGFYCDWDSDLGPKMTVDSQGVQVLSQETVWSGNRAVALDNYNTFFDPSVEPSQVYCKGEFAARVWIESRHNLTTKASQGRYFNCETALKDNAQGVNLATYYRSPPAEAKMQNDQSRGTNWIAILSMTEGYAQTVGYELVEISIKLNPYQLNLVPRTKLMKQQRNRLEVWNITILNDKWIIETRYMDNMHGYIPYFFGSLNDDLMGRSAKSVSEIIKPLSTFASFLMNTHMAATRKNIWGLMAYDSNVIDLNQIPEGEVAARIGTKVGMSGRKLQDSIWESNKLLDTKQTMDDLENVLGMLNTFYPTMSLPSQVASIDRAVTDQVAAVQQGANRRLHKGGRLLDDLMFRPLRFCMYYNVIQKQEDGVMVSDFYGKPVKIDLSRLRETDLPFIIGQGLKMLDRTKLAGDLQNIIFALIQNPAAAARFDMPGLINFWADMIDLDLDLRQFALQTTMDENGQPVTTQPGAAAAGEVDPMTNPNAMTGALVKPGVAAPV